MSIYTSINVLIEKLDRSIFASDEVPDSIMVVQTLREIMPEIWRYAKNINPRQWEWIMPYIDSDEEIAISTSMYRDAAVSWKLSKEQLYNKKGAGGFFGGLFAISYNLLFFSRDYEESCDFCQGELIYWVWKKGDSDIEILVTECATCLRVNNARTGQSIETHDDDLFRRAVKADLEGFY
ncbi:hypothetical protein [Saccharibacillus sacchari]|uniref:Uncharacterized protein n=1 Tax=Saccharibacillus sacchari TaxID=456493 RepID=A0ACC6PAB9_9BACL